MKKILCIMHKTPPVHGAAVVGDQVYTLLNSLENLDVELVTLGSGNSISDLAGVSLRKINATLKVFFAVLLNLIVRRNDIVYFTPSLGGFAFYRDIIISLMLKVYMRVTKCKVFLHIHMRPEILSNKIINRVFFKVINGFELILLSGDLEVDYGPLISEVNVHSLPNGIESLLPHDIELAKLVSSRKRGLKTVLYLGHLITSKGFKRALEIAALLKNDRNIVFKFAGEFGSDHDRLFFYDFIKKHGLNNVEYLGVVKGQEKVNIFSSSSVLILPSYSEALPLTILEAFSMGLPVLATPVGAIPEVLSSTISITCVSNTEFAKEILNLLELYDLNAAHELVLKYNDHYSPKVFEESLKNILEVN
jgi:glycosyltransferase involved in cell wall biosynthesis